MTFGFKTAGEVIKVMHFIIYGFLGVILETYIDDIVVKSDGLDSHLADLRLTFKRMHRFGLKMNPLKCASVVRTGKFLGSISEVQAPTCNRELQKFLGKVNYFRIFISNLFGKIHAFTLIIGLKDEVEFT